MHMLEITSGNVSFTQWKIEKEKPFLNISWNITRFRHINNFLEPFFN